ncbi:MAG TPA: hypothetical protein VHL34_24945 [Rhizomicrobium sp.]|jgi:hypothetical protein|nr:hypothetical protein [Rhizomicrobium sp.]
MIRFVDNTNYTRSFATSEIVEIGEAKSRAGRHGSWHEAKLRDGTHVSIYPDTVAELSDPVVAVIPATAGYSTASAGRCLNGETWSWRETVIAWRIRASGDVEPVTIRGIETGDCAVELPSGEVWSALDEAHYDNFAAFEKAQLEKAGATKEADHG